MVALSGDYDFQFMMEELAVGAQFNLPYIHVLVNNAYLGLIRQSQRGFDMDYCVQLAFDNINRRRDVERLRRRPRQGRRGPGLQGDAGLRPRGDPARAGAAKKLLVEHRVPVMVEVILERVTNISMGMEIDNVVEFEELATLPRTRPPPSRCWTDRDELDVVLRAPRVITEAGEVARSVGVAAGRIAAIEPYESAPPAGRVVELGDDVVLLPGLVDTHVHVNEPGPHRVGGLRDGHARRRRGRRDDDRGHAAEQHPADRRRRRAGGQAGGRRGPGARRRRLLGRRGPRQPRRPARAP